MDKVLNYIKKHIVTVIIAVATLIAAIGGFLIGRFEKIAEQKSLSDDTLSDGPAPYAISAQSEDNVSDVSSAAGKDIPSDAGEDFHSLTTEESLEEILNSWDISNLTDDEKSRLSACVGLLGGIVHFKDDSIVIKKDGITSTYYFDDTYTMIDENGCGGGTHWVDCDISAKVPQISGIPIDTCMVEPGRFAVTYKDVIEDIFDMYRGKLKNAGFKEEFSSVVIFTGVDDEGYKVTAALENGILTVFLESPAAEEIPSQIPEDVIDIPSESKSPA